MNAHECPFCGCRGTAKTIKVDSGFHVECNNCGARGPTGWRDKKSAIISWNSGDLSYGNAEKRFYRSKIEKLAIQGALSESDRSITEAAKLMDMSRDTLKLRILHHGPVLLRHCDLLS